jgi:hypothetical protein
MKVLRFFPYRTAFVRGDDVLEFPRRLFKDLEFQLAKDAGISADNHTCYEVEVNSFPMNRIVYLMFTDLNVRMGNRIDEERW